MFDFMEMCHNCGHMVYTFGHEVVVCPICGDKWNPLIDYSHPTASQIEEQNNLEIYGGLNFLFKKSTSEKYKIELSDEDLSNFAKDTFDIVKLADGRSGQGFAVDFGTFKGLCQSVRKWRSIPDQNKVVIRSNPFDDSVVNSNIMDTLGYFALEKSDCGTNKLIVLDPVDIICNHSVGIAVLTTLHELMHAAMFVAGKESKDDYWYYKEEAYANAFALKLLKASTHKDWYKEAFEFVKKQPEGYNTGAKLVNEIISMEEWRKEKADYKSATDETMRCWKEKYINQ